MKPPDHVDVAPWLALAAADLAIAELVVANPASNSAMLGLACFHAQQAAEKALKAMLVASDRPVPRTHSLMLLLDGVDLAVADHIAYSCAHLNDYGVGPRYPGLAIAADPKSASAAVAAATQVAAWVVDQLGGPANRAALG